jgi:hypothetical protein
MLPLPEKNQNPAELGFMRFQKGESHLKKMAPEVGLEFTQGTLFFNDLQNR